MFTSVRWNRERWRRGSAALLAAWLAAQAAPSPGLREAGHIELPGIAGRMDHLAIDPAGQRLFVAALGAGEVDIVDLHAGRRTARLEGLREAQGVVFEPSSRRLYVAAGESGEVVAFDGERRVGVAHGLPDADNLRFSDPDHRLVAGYGEALAFLDPADLSLVGRIGLPGHPEAFELARHGPEVYVNVPAAGRVLVLDRRSGRTLAQWEVAPEAANFPMALDEAGHRLYVGTRRPARLIVFDTSTGRRLGDLALCGDVDDLFLDPERRRLLAVCGEGEVDVWSTAREVQGEPMQRLATEAGARTGGLLPSEGTLYVAAPARPGRPARVTIYRSD